MTDTEALKALVAACEKEFCSPATEGGELVSADDESVMGPGECAITFGKIRAARAALERMLASQGEQREAQGAEVPEVTHYQGARVKCTPHMRPIIDMESRDNKFDYFLVRAEVKSAPPLAEPDVEAMAKEFAEAIDFTAGRPEARDVFRELFLKHLRPTQQTEGTLLDSKISGLVNGIRSLILFHTKNGTMHSDCASDFAELVAPYPSYAPSGEVINEAAAPQAEGEKQDTKP